MVIIPLVQVLQSLFLHIVIAEQIQAIQIKCYHEIITIGHRKYTEK